jgi:hypothetical protein
MKIIKLNTPRNNFTNITFKNPSDEERYSTLMSNITGAFLQIEYLSVVEGTRDAHLMFIRPNEVEQRKAEFKKYGLEIILLNKEMDDMSGGYGNHASDWDGNGNYTWRAIITRPQFINTWKEIWEADCCAKHFTEVWMRRGGIDTTWQQAACTVAGTPDYVEAEKIMGDCNAIELPRDTQIWGSNLIRWAGLKFVTHLPCSFSCGETRRIAMENIAIATKYGFSYEYQKLYEMLDWETSWTAEFGVATIDTPIFTIQTITDITAVPYKVIKKGHNNCIL